MRYQLLNLLKLGAPFLLTAVLVTGCALAPAAPTTLPPTQTSQPTAIPPSPTATLPPATATPLPPTATPPPTETSVPTPRPTEPPPPAGTQTVQIFLIAIDDNGISGPLVGCGDSAVGVTVPISPTVGVLRAALTKLLTLKDQFYGQSGLYNALYQSSLQLQDVTIENGVAKIYLTGSFMLGGECDNPRVKAQLERTALQFSTVSSVSIFVNNQPIDDVLSLK
jgi:hypothetical protein